MSGTSGEETAGKPLPPSAVTMATVLAWIIPTYVPAAVPVSPMASE
jgi:hypothetical protein